ncbi:unnamed protein product [Ilex paraguariensis]|uniref:Uncharacterized protein n=1 Tax=Ilex paraguariensis TaxID=185542 RepID=A0ABC8RCW0_9AQUA
MPRPLPNGKGSLAQILISTSESPESLHTPIHVVLVMDGLRALTLKPLEWVLRNVVLGASCTITLLGVTPWLNIPREFSSKTWSEIWAKDLEDLLSIKETLEWKSDVKYQKVQQVIDLCRKYGVVPQMRTGSGYPLNLLVIEQITNLHPKLVVFDRHHHRKYIEYYAERLPCNIVVMKDDGQVDMIKGRSHVDDVESTPGESPATSAQRSPLLILSDHLKQILKIGGGAREKKGKDREASPGG